MRRKICVVTLFLVFIGQIVMAGGNTADFKYGKWHLKYTLSTGSTEYIYQGKTVFDKVGTGVSGAYTEYEIGQEEITDGFGTGMCFTVTRSGENLPSVIQRFFLYEGKDYFLTDVALSPTPVVIFWKRAIIVFLSFRLITTNGYAIVLPI